MMSKFINAVVRNWKKLSDYEKICLLRIPNFDTNFDPEFLENVRLIRLWIKKGKSLYIDERTRYIMLTKKEMRERGLIDTEEIMLCRMFHFYLGELQLNTNKGIPRKLLSLDQKRILKEFHFYELYNIDFEPRKNQTLQPNLNLFANDIIVNNGIVEKFGMNRIRQSYFQEKKRT
mmetsp:Transcript_699/g.770  ORF Transcript_699/g.770 Transcript_699/m.770 type:complete len:175 (+) Transcript_699:169-693(+)